MSMGQGIILKVHFPEKSALYQAYMSFLKNGGLFIQNQQMHSQREHKLGDEVFMMVKLMDEQEQLPVAGRVVWITPKGSQGGRSAGIGVQFSDQDKGQARNRIENILAGMMKLDRVTHTL